MSESKQQFITSFLSTHSAVPTCTQASAFAPVNIALCKYWGKRDTALNLPLTDSLSIALPKIGTQTELELIDAASDQIYLNGEQQESDTEFSKKLVAFLDLFRPKKDWHLKINTRSDVPVAAGLASSASGFAALVLALQQLFAWPLSKQELSILARLGSGSACRSLWNGFVHWQAGTRADGLDSYGLALPQQWPDLRLGLLIFHQKPKAISSRLAMQCTVETSVLYQRWPEQVNRDLKDIQAAITEKDFEKLGSSAEKNALAMHATMLSSWPPILFSSEETFAAMQKIWQLRAEGIAVYFTQDAGPHLKLLFLKQDQARIMQAFAQIKIVEPF